MKRNRQFKGTIKIYIDRNSNGSLPNFANILLTNDKMSNEMKIRLHINDYLV
jgi:hypothetical protein